MLSSRLPEPVGKIIITEYDYDSILQLLTGNLSITESTILKKHPASKMKALSDVYLEEMQKLVKQLRNISREYFLKVSGKTRRLYQRIEDQSDTYCMYSNALENISAFVLHDIISKKKFEHILFAAERWANILKMSFESNDYFTCAAIITALNRWPILNINIQNKLSPNSFAIIDTIQPIFLTPKVLGKLQEKKAKREEEVIPVLSCLAHLLEMVSIQPKHDDTKEYILEQKEKYSLIYENMQKALNEPLIDGVIGMVLFFLNKTHDTNTIFAYQGRVDKIKKKKTEINALSLIKNISFYTSYDIHYVYSMELNNLRINFSKDVNGKLSKNEEPLWNRVSDILLENTGSAEKLRQINEINLSDYSDMSGVLNGFILNVQSYLHKIACAQAHIPAPPSIRTNNTMPADIKNNNAGKASQSGIFGNTRQASHTKRDIKKKNHETDELSGDISQLKKR